MPVFSERPQHSHPRQRCVRAPISAHSHQHLLSVFSIIAIPVGVTWRIAEILIRVSLMTSGAENVFMRLLALCMHSLGKCVFKSFAHCLSYFFLLLNYKNPLYILHASPLPDLKEFSPILWVVFSRSLQCPLKPRSFLFRSSPIYFSFCQLYFWYEI